MSGIVSRTWEAFAVPYAIPSTEAVAKRIEVANISKSLGIRHWYCNASVPKIHDFLLERGHYTRSICYVKILIKYSRVLPLGKRRISV